jgi:hypothetical protein
MMQQSKGTTMTNRNTLAAVMKAIVDAIAIDGTPAGTLYATLMTQGCTIGQYEQIEAAMVAAGVVEKKGNILYRTVSI